MTRAVLQSLVRRYTLWRLRRWTYYQRLKPQLEDPENLCDRAPKGWFCTRKRAHDGPCAGWPKGGGILPGN